MLHDNEVFIELPLSYLHDKCTGWDSLCEAIGLPPDCLEDGYCEPDQTVRLSLALAKSHDLCRDWQL